MAPVSWTAELDSGEPSDMRVMRDHTRGLSPGFAFEVPHRWLHTGPCTVPTPSLSGGLQPPTCDVLLTIVSASLGSSPPSPVMRYLMLRPARIEFTRPV